ncbi:hypothetical protein ABZ399_29605 [Micromonospora aurantiaca]|uniref:hypothetical protein n=1 Tax=Micromonospora aurantiaca (nom. illeg.) TaxID=47850 RepID=UPI003404E557
MSEHTPQHHNPHPDPAVDTGPLAEVDPTAIDLVAGDPPVPLTVWRTGRTPGDAGRSIGTRLAGRLIAAYSRPGEAVVDLTTDHALTQACAAGARRHHPAWFTGTSSLIIGPGAAAPPAGATVGTEPGEEDDLPEMGAWFGDDLTDPQLHPPTDTAADPPPDNALQQATSLVVACWPLHEHAAANRVRLAWLLTACAALLQPGGCLILVVTVPAGTTTGPQDFSGVVQAAASAGLGYLQHLVAVTADTDGDAFVYHVTDEELLTLTTDQRWQMAHLRVHADLMVFSQAQSRAPRRRGGREGGGRRG